MKSISVRIKGATKDAIKGQVKHDARIGHQPAHVDKKRADRNTIICAPSSAEKLLETCEYRRKKGGKVRKMKSSAHVATNGIITFSKDAQVIIDELKDEEQDDIFSDVAQKIAAKMKTSLTGLVVHRDESAIHAHFQMPAINLEGQPLSKAHIDYSELQEIAGDAVAHIGITRGKKKSARIADKEADSTHINRSVKKLHSDLPNEIALLEKQALEALESLSKQQKLLKQVSAEAYKTNLSLGVRKSHLERIESKILIQGQQEKDALSLVTKLLTSPDHAVRSKIKHAILAHNDKDLEESLGLSFKR